MELDAYLRRSLAPSRRAALRAHLDACPPCWGRWNRHRWDAAIGHPLLDQLAAFLGESYQPYVDSSRALAEEWDRADPQTAAEVAAFFQTSTSYLYNLTVWEASGNRPAYVDAALPHLCAHRVRTVLDIGSGIGSDALALSDRGYSVTTCDFDSPSTRFCDHRASVPISRVAPADLGLAHAADALWIIDTLDHLPNPGRTLDRVLPAARLVVTEDLSESRGHGRQRFHHRRPWAQIRELFGRFTFQPHLADPVMVWTRAEMAKEPP